MLADAGTEPRRERTAALCLAASHAGAVLPTSKTGCEAMAHCPFLPSVWSPRWCSGMISTRDMSCGVTPHAAEPGR